MKFAIGFIVLLVLNLFLFNYYFLGSKHLIRARSVEPCPAEKKKGKEEESGPLNALKDLVMGQPSSPASILAESQRFLVHWLQNRMVPKLRAGAANLTTAVDVEKLVRVFEKTFLNTIDTTVTVLQNENQNDPLRTFVITGDIEAMWLRDSAMQVEHYVDCCAGQNAALDALLAGLVRQHAFLAMQDPYANSFNSHPSWSDRRHGLRRGGYVATGNYELDSWAFSVRLAHRFWKKSNRTDHFDEYFRLASSIMLIQWKKEQEHDMSSTYRYEELTTGRHNNPSGKTGMTWTAFRPSDDPVKYHYHVPDNMLASVAMRQSAEIARSVYGDERWAGECTGLANELDDGIRKFGVVRDPDNKDQMLYAYEVDGLGHQNLMDDANIPSLLSVPLLGWPYDKAVYAATRKFILSKRNTQFFEGKAARGIGSPHTPFHHIWPMSLCVQAMTSESPDEQLQLLATLLATDGNTDLMHESFNADNPAIFTRRWFAWANSVFALLVMQLFDL